jgi:small subunit ribosomal protein S20
MPRIKLANKTARATERRRLRNSVTKNRMRTAIVKVGKLIVAGNMELAGKEMVKAISDIDKAVSAGVIHRNKGARLKSQLTRQLNQAMSKGKGD